MSHLPLASVLSRVILVVPMTLCLGVVPDAKDRAAVVALMRATFPMLAPEEVARAVGVTP